MKKLALFLLLAGSVGAQTTKKPVPKPKPECSNGEGYGTGQGNWECRKGKWVNITPEMQADVDVENRRREKLYFALRSRPLLPDEMEQVIHLDWHLTEYLEVTGMYGPDYETEKRRQFNDALLQQFKLQTAAKASDPCPAFTPIPNFDPHIGNMDCSKGPC